MTTAISKPITGPELKAIHALWRQIDAGRGDDRDSRTARLTFISMVLARPVDTAKDLSSDEALKVIEAMKQETGQAWKPRGGGWSGRRRKVSGAKVRVSGAEQAKLGELAADLWGERWNEMLAARLAERFRVRSPRSLAPAQARQMVEELLQRLAVRHIADRQATSGCPRRPISRIEIEAEKVRLRRHYFGAANSEL